MLESFAQEMHSNMNKGRIKKWRIPVKEKIVGFIY